MVMSGGVGGARDMCETRSDDATTTRWVNGLTECNGKGGNERAGGSGEVE